MFQWLFANRGMRFSALDKWCALGVFVGCSWWIQFLTYSISTDFSAHAKFAEKMFSEGDFFSGSLLYFTYWVVNFFGDSRFIGSTGFIMGGFCFLKYVFSVAIIKDYLIRNSLKEFSTHYWVSLLPLAVVMVAPLPWHFNYLLSGAYYLGSFPITVWHNPTTLATIPFAILLFYFSYRLATQFSKHDYLICLLLILINIGIKPSYLFVWGPVFPLFVMICLLFQKEKLFTRQRLFYLLKIGILILIALGLILLLKSFLYPAGGDSKVIISFESKFFYWGSRTLNFYQKYRSTFEGNAVLHFLTKTQMRMFWLLCVPWVFLLSTAYPLLVLLMYLRRKWLDLPIMLFALIGVLWGDLIFVIFVETGWRSGHGNFMWQVSMVNAVMFAVAIMASLRSHFAAVQEARIRTGNARAHYFDRFFWLLNLALAAHIYYGVLLILALYYGKKAAWLI